MVNKTDKQPLQLEDRNSQVKGPSLVERRKILSFPDQLYSGNQLDG